MLLKRNGKRIKKNFMRNSTRRCPQLLMQIFQICKRILIINQILQLILEFQSSLIGIKITMEKTNLRENEKDD